MSQEKRAIEWENINKPLQEHEFQIKTCYERAAVVPLFMVLLGIAIKWHDYFLCRE